MRPAGFPSLHRDLPTGDLMFPGNDAAQMFEEFCLADSGQFLAQTNHRLGEKIRRAACAPRLSSI